MNSHPHHTWLAIVPAADPQTENTEAPMPGLQIKLSADTPDELTKKLHDALKAVGGFADKDLKHTGNDEQGSIFADEDLQVWSRLDWYLYPCNSLGVNINRGYDREQYSVGD